MGNQSIKLFQTPNKTQMNDNSFEIPVEDKNILKTIGFDINDTIGVGNMGTVYRGTYGSTAIGIRDVEDQLLDVCIDEEFAVKYIDIRGRNVFKKSIFEQNIKQFIDDMRQLGSYLWHPNLVSYNICLHMVSGDTTGDSSGQLGQSGDTTDQSYESVYLFMNYSQYGNLDNYLRELSGKGLSVGESEAKSWCQQLVSALGCLHRLDTIHGNIKANNVLLFKEFSESERKHVLVAKLSDFGLNPKYWCLNSNIYDNYVTDNTADDDNEDNEINEVVDEIQDVVVIEWKYF
jgi:serine/threonine protein kinase